MQASVINSGFTSGIIFGLVVGVLIGAVLFVLLKIIYNDIEQAVNNIVQTIPDGFIITMDISNVHTAVYLNDEFMNDKGYIDDDSMNISQRILLAQYRAHKLSDKKVNKIKVLESTKAV